MMKIPKKKIGIIIEVKYPKDGNLDVACLDALRQIEMNKYESALVRDGVTNILKYGIAFYKKACKVLCAAPNS